jgi:hypothetical protein
MEARCATAREHSRIFAKPDIPPAQPRQNSERKIMSTTMQKPKSRRQFEEQAQRAHIARIRHVSRTCGDDLALRTKLLDRCSTLYREDLARAEADYRAQQRALGMMR